MTVVKCYQSYLSSCRDLELEKTLSKVIASTWCLNLFLVYWYHVSIIQRVLFPEYYKLSCHVYLY